MLKKRFKIGEIIKSMFPNLPTDNLYKFCFVGSIFLLGLLIFVRHNEYNKLLSLKIQYEREATYLRFDVKNYNSSTDKDESQKKVLNLKISDINKNIAEVKDNISKFNEQANLSRILYIVLTLSIILFALLWYYKLQRYLDEILKKQANEPINTSKM